MFNIFMVCVLSLDFGPFIGKKKWNFEFPFFHKTSSHVFCFRNSLNVVTSLAAKTRWNEENIVFTTVTFIYNVWHFQHISMEEMFARNWCPIRMFSVFEQNGGTPHTCTSFATKEIEWSECFQVIEKKKNRLFIWSAAVGHILNHLAYKRTQQLTMSQLLRKCPVSVETAEFKWIVKGNMNYWANGKI